MTWRLRKCVCVRARASRELGREILFSLKQWEGSPTHVFRNAHVAVLKCSWNLVLQPLTFLLIKCPGQVSLSGCCTDEATHFKPIAEGGSSLPVSCGDVVSLQFSSTASQWSVSRRPTSATRFAQGCKLSVFLFSSTENTPDLAGAGPPLFGSPLPSVQFVVVELLHLRHHKSVTDEVRSASIANLRDHPLVIQRERLSSTANIPCNTPRHDYVCARKRFVAILVQYF